MSVPKLRRFTYYERIKSTLQMVHDPETKLMCSDLLNFIANCMDVSKQKVLDFTDEKSEERISCFLVKDGTFFSRLVESFCKFSRKGLFDLLSKDNSQKKELNKSRILISTIEKTCYQILCLSAFYCPLELQHSFVTLFSGFLFKHQPENIFGTLEITAWTCLILLINPLKLKKQCDGSVEIFTHFNKALQDSPQQSPSISRLKWANPCLKGTIQLALGVSIKYARNSLGLGIPHELNEATFVDEGIKNMAFEFLQAYIVQVPTFHEFSFSIDTIDSVLKNFICYFPYKLVEMYNLCEEELYSLLDDPRKPIICEGAKSAKQPNFENLHFKALLELISALYEPETPQLAQLSMEFTDPNCESLCDFIYKGKAISAPPLKIAYLSMLRSLCKNPQSAEVFFNMFK